MDGSEPGWAFWERVHGRCLGRRPGARQRTAVADPGFNEGKGRPFTAQDVRFTTKGNILYAIVLGWPTNGMNLESLGKSAKLLDPPIEKIQSLGSREEIDWRQTDGGLFISQPRTKPSDIAIVFAITLKT